MSKPLHIESFNTEEAILILMMGRPSDVVIYYSSI